MRDVAAAFIVSLTVLGLFAGSHLVYASWPCCSANPDHHATAQTITEMQVDQLVIHVTELELRVGKLEQELHSGKR